MICMSSSATTKLIDEVAEGFDAEVMVWSDALKRNVMVRVKKYRSICIIKSCYRLVSPFYHLVDQMTLMLTVMAVVLLLIIVICLLVNFLTLKMIYQVVSMAVK